MDNSFDIRVAETSDMVGETSGRTKSSSVTAASELSPLDTVLVGFYPLIEFVING